jgi:hypothetical protein
MNEHNDPVELVEGYAVNGCLIANQRVDKRSTSISTGSVEQSLISGEHPLREEHHLHIDQSECHPAPVFTPTPAVRPAGSVSNIEVKALPFGKIIATAALLASRLSLTSI